MDTKNIKQELEVVSKDLELRANTFENWKIKKQEDLDSAQEAWKELKDQQKKIETMKKEATDPLNKSLKIIRSWFAPVEDKVQEQISKLGYSILTYKREQDLKAEEQKRKTVDKLEKGEIDIEKASVKIEKIESKTAPISTMKTRAIEIVDENLIPDEYWEINMVNLRKDALDGKEIPGVKIVIKETLLNH